MNKKFTTLGASVLVAFGLLTAPSVASATTCVPSDAWVETIEHPAVGDPMIANPDYVPATEGYFITVPPTKPGHGGGKGGHGGHGGGKPTQVWVEGTPAIGEPFIANPNHVPAWTETINHDAVECEVVPPVDPEEPEVPGDGDADGGETPVDPEVPGDGDADGEEESPATPEVPANPEDSPVAPLTPVTGNVLPKPSEVVVPAAVASTPTPPADIETAAKGSLAVTGSNNNVALLLGGSALVATAAGMLVRGRVVYGRRK